MEVQEFPTVWYRQAENKLEDMQLPAYQDVGKLSIHKGSIVFRGRVEVVLITDIARVSYGKQGRDFINNWVKVEYGEAPVISTAYFADGGLRGWSGIFGGTRKIFCALTEFEWGERKHELRRM